MENPFPLALHMPSGKGLWMTALLPSPMNVMEKHSHFAPCYRTKRKTKCLVCIAGNKLDSFPVGVGLHRGLSQFLF